MLNTERLCPGCMNDNGGEQICPICGYNSANKNDADKLPVRFWLSERYMVGRVLAVSSEGITYLGWDNIQNVPVNIKEYFPSGVSYRLEDKAVSMDVNHRFSFNEGLMAFIELNSKLMSLELPSLLPTTDVFEENGTAYSVSGAIAGITLASFLERNGGSLKWEQIRPLLLPLIDTVKGLHDARIIHGGISPETIIVGRDGKLKLTGLSILNTRCAGGDIPAQVYSGYAAIEQYGAQNMTVGAYTDIYGLSATLFRVIIGTVPPDAQSRLENDNMEIPAHFADELPRQVLVAMANGLQVRPEARTTTVESFKNELVYGETQENARKAAAVKRAEAAAAAKRAQEMEEARKMKEQKSQNISSSSAPRAAAVASATPKKPASNAKKQKEKGSSGAKAAVISALCTVIACVLVIAIAVVAIPTLRNAIFPKDDDGKTNNNAPQFTSSETDEEEDSKKFTQLYKVPSFVGQTYAAVTDNSDYERFEFVVVDREFNDDVPRGQICRQLVKEGTTVEKGAKVELVISLGPKEVNIKNVVGKTEKEAMYILCVEQGFFPENIEIIESYDQSKEDGTVIRQTPKVGNSKVSVDVKIQLFVNKLGENEN